MKTLTMTKQLEELSKKYVWWESPYWSAEHPEVFLANLMNLGTWDDICLVRHLLGDKLLKEALTNAPPGYFSDRAWDYWHLKFKLTPIPPLPQRKFR